MSGFRIGLITPADELIEIILNKRKSTSDVILLNNQVAQYSLIDESIHWKERISYEKEAEFYKLKEKIMKAWNTAASDDPEVSFWLYFFAVQYFHETCPLENDENSFYQRNHQKGILMFEFIRQLGLFGNTELTTALEFLRKLMAP